MIARLDLCDLISFGCPDQAELFFLFVVFIRSRAQDAHCVWHGRRRSGGGWMVCHGPRRERWEGNEGVEVLGLNDTKVFVVISRVRGQEGFQIKSMSWVWIRGGWEAREPAECEQNVSTTASFILSVSVYRTSCQSVAQRWNVKMKVFTKQRHARRFVDESGSHVGPNQEKESSKCA